MKQKSILRKFFSGISMMIMLALMSLSYNSCGNAKTAQQAAPVDDDAFYATQPVHSGLYDADYYDITGTGAKKGHFDGRIYFSLSPETNAFYVFENGNRTKIDYMVNLQHPFEKNDTGVFVSVDQKDRLVTIAPDSTNLILDFQRSGEDIKITFSPKPRHEGSALDILEKMAAQRNKNK